MLFVYQSFSWTILHLDYFDCYFQIFISAVTAVIDVDIPNFVVCV